MGYQGEYGFHCTVYSEGEKIFSSVSCVLLLYFVGMVGSFVLGSEVQVYCMIHAGVLNGKIE